MTFSALFAARLGVIRSEYLFAKGPGDIGNSASEKLNAKPSKANGSCFTESRRDGVLMCGCNFSAEGGHDLSASNAETSSTLSTLATLEGTSTAPLLSFFLRRGLYAARGKQISA
jgi:hypothetical protein